MTQLGALDDVDLRRDRVLVELAQAGDVEAFGQLYDRYFSRLERFCVKRLGDATEAEEVAQETFTRAWRALPTFGGERRFYPWITVIAGRICVDTVRRQSRLEVGKVEDAAVVEQGFTRLETEGDLAALRTALGRITRRHREALELRETYGWSYQHIAEHYDVSVGTVEALLWRARQSLRREFMALCSCFAGLPMVRRWTAGSGTSSSGTMAALGSVGTVVALVIGAGGPLAGNIPKPPAHAEVAAVSVRAIPAGSPLLQVSLPPSAPRTPTTRPAVPATTPAPEAAGPTAIPHDATPPRAPAGDGLSPLVPRPQVLSPAAASAAAREKPIVVDLAPLGPVVGLDPGVPISPIHLVSGGAK